MNHAYVQCGSCGGVGCLTCRLRGYFTMETEMEHITVKAEQAGNFMSLAGPSGIPGASGLQQGNQRHPASARFHAILGELAELHNRKQQDYGTDTDPFANVRGSSEWGIEPWVGAMVRATDKVRRLQSFLKHGKLRNESVDDSLRDLAVYAIIALVLFEEGTPPK